MTIASTQTKVIYGGNGSTAVFAIPFAFLANEDIQVILTSSRGTEKIQNISTDYHLSGVGEPTGGTCSMSIPPEIGQTLVIRRNPTIVQEVDYVENDAFPAQTHEAALDKLTMICQTLAERLDRTITFKVSSAVSGIEVPEPDPGRFIGWSETGEALVNRDIGDATAVGLPLSISNGGTGAENREEAFENFGFGETGIALIHSTDQAEALAAINAEPADTAILKANQNARVAALFSDTWQTHEGTSLTDFIPESNKVMWELSDDSTFDELHTPTPVSLIFHIRPVGHSLSFAAPGIYTMFGDDFDTTAPLVRVCVDITDTDKCVTICNGASL